MRSTVSPEGVSVGVPGRPHEDDRLARRELRAQVGRAAHFEHDGGEQAVLAIDRGAGEREPFLGEPRAVGAARERLVVLQPVELPGLEGARRHRRTHHDLDDGGREPVDRVHGRAQLVVEPRDQRPRGERGRREPRQHPADHRIALLGARHRLHHVAGEGRMQIAEEADGAAVRAQAHQHMRGGEAW